MSKIPSLPILEPLGEYFVAVQTSGTMPCDIDASIKQNNMVGGAGDALVKNLNLDCKDVDNYLKYEINVPYNPTENEINNFIKRYPQHTREQIITFAKWCQHIKSPESKLSNLTQPYQYPYKIDTNKKIELWKQITNEPSNSSPGTLQSSSPSTQPSSSSGSSTDTQSNTSNSQLLWQIYTSTHCYKLDTNIGSNPANGDIAHQFTQAVIQLAKNLKQIDNPTSGGTIIQLFNQSVETVFRNIAFDDKDTVTKTFTSPINYDETSKNYTLTDNEKLIFKDTEKNEYLDILNRSMTKKIKNLNSEEDKANSGNCLTILFRILRNDDKIFTYNLDNSGKTIIPKAEMEVQLNFFKENIIKSIQKIINNEIKNKCFYVPFSTIQSSPSAVETLDIISDTTNTEFIKFFNDYFNIVCNETVGDDKDINSVIYPTNYSLVDRNKCRINLLKTDSGKIKLFEELLPKKGVGQIYATSTEKVKGGYSLSDIAECFYNDPLTKIINNESCENNIKAMGLNNFINNSPKVEDLSLVKEVCPVVKTDGKYNFSVVTGKPDSTAKSEVFDENAFREATVTWATDFKTKNEIPKVKESTTFLGQALDRMYKNVRSSDEEDEEESDNEFDIKKKTVLTVDKYDTYLARSGPENKEIKIQIINEILNKNNIEIPTKYVSTIPVPVGKTIPVPESTIPVPDVKPPAQPTNRQCVAIKAWLRSNGINGPRQLTVEEYNNIKNYTGSEKLGIKEDLLKKCLEIERYGLPSGVSVSEPTPKAITPKATTTTTTKPTTEEVKLVADECEIVKDMFKRNTYNNQLTDNEYVRIKRSITSRDSTMNEDKIKKCIEAAGYKLPDGTVASEPAVISTVIPPVSPLVKPVSPTVKSVSPTIKSVISSSTTSPVTRTVGFDAEAVTKVLNAWLRSEKDSVIYSQPTYYNRPSYSDKPDEKAIWDDKVGTYNYSVSNQFNNLNQNNWIRVGNTYYEVDSAGTKTQFYNNDKKDLNRQLQQTCGVMGVGNCVENLQKVSSGGLEKLMELLSNTDGILSTLRSEPKGLAEKLPPQIALKILKTLGVKKTMAITSKGNVYLLEPLPNWEKRIQEQNKKLYKFYDDNRTNIQDLLIFLMALIERNPTLLGNKPEMVISNYNKKAKSDKSDLSVYGTVTIKVDKLPETKTSSSSPELSLDTIMREFSTRPDSSFYRGIKLYNSPFLGAEFDFISALLQGNTNYLVGGSRTGNKPNVQFGLGASLDAKEGQLRNFAKELENKIKETRDVELSNKVSVANDKLNDLSTEKLEILRALSIIVKLDKLRQLGLMDNKIASGESFSNWYTTNPYDPFDKNANLNTYNELVKYSDQLLDEYYKKYNSIDMMLKLLEEQLVTKTGPILYKNVNPYDFKYQSTGYYF